MIAAFATVLLVTASPALAEFAVARDNRRIATSPAPVARPEPVRHWPRTRKKPRIQPVAVAAPAPVVMAPAALLPPPSPAVRPTWPAPAGWELSQAGTVCTLQTSAGDAGTIRLLDWKTREFTLQDFQDGLTAEAHAQIQIDLTISSQPGAKPLAASASVRRMEIQIGEVRFGLQARGAGDPVFRAPVTPALLAALSTGGKARLSVDGRKGTKFRIADGAAALRALDACMGNARMQPLSPASARAS